MKLTPTLMADFYKLGHKNQYPDKTEVVYSTWTPRSGKHLPYIKEVVAFGFQGFFKELKETFDESFFSVSKEEAIGVYSRIVKNCLGVANPETTHLEELHDLGYLPLKVKALEEGTLVPFRVPMLTIENTDNRFFWLTNYVETMASANLWKPCTAASVARVYRQVLDKAAIETTGSTAGVEFQGHDFSMRGMSGVEDAARTGGGHLLSFVGTDTIPAIQYLEQYYGANVEKELVGCSVNATEHSVMCAGGKEDERETYRRLIEDIYPTGIVSIVSDTWDLWNTLENIVPSLKESILERNGGEESLDKVVIRPDSGDPADILCGNETSRDSRAQKGVVELLWDTFGGTVNDQGYKVLNPAVGAIYGDAITVERCQNICDRLKAKGFASTNVVFGIGSYTYQYQTRDSLGFAMKATSVTINGVEKAIFKDPITDDGTKKSAKGKVSVVDTDNGLYCIDESEGIVIKGRDLLETIFEDGKMIKETTLAQVRARLAENS
tara:strand:- start:1386 stop:2870 length:1485 start_codon:yes stop_codon:yes gene_type:complete